MIQFMMALKEDRVRLSATGLFNVGMDLIPNVNWFQIYSILLNILWIFVSDDWISGHVFDHIITNCSWNFG